MTREVIVDLPKKYRKHIGDAVFVEHEEEAICWLWAHPELLSWSAPVVWLYTPVVGNAKWPGDLWGIDCNGDLLAIEAKRSIRRADAFIDFLHFHRRGREELSSRHWKQKWSRHLKSEVASPDGIRQRLKGQTAGMLPRSNGRRHIRTWPALAKRIDACIRSGSYSQNVLEYLKTRESKNNPVPYYLALIVAPSGNENPVLSASTSSAKALAKRIGKTHVVAFSISCKQVKAARARIKTTSIDLS